MGVKLHRAGYREPGILRLREMRQLEVGPIQIAQELFRLQAVGPVALHRSAILEKGQFRQVDVLSRQSHGGGQAVVGLPFYGSAGKGKVAPSVQVAKHSPRMGLQIQSASYREILPDKRQKIGERSVLHLGVSID